METCFEWMHVVSVGVKVESLFASLPSVVSYTVTGIMCRKESAVQCVKVHYLFNPLYLLILLLSLFWPFKENKQALHVVVVKFANCFLIQFIFNFLGCCVWVHLVFLWCFSDVDTLPFSYRAAEVSFPFCIRTFLDMATYAVLLGDLLPKGHKKLLLISARGI